MTAQQERAIARVCEKECLQRELVEALEGIVNEFRSMPCPNGWYRADVHADEITNARAVLARAKEQQA